MTFTEWMQEVDDHCMTKFGISIHDLPDLPFYDAFECGNTAEEFMEETLPDLDALATLVLS